MSYYGRPILKRPVWKPEVALYFFTGGLAGASAALAFAARLRGNDRLARRALINATAAGMASPVLLISDLGRPERFHHMLRVVKPTSPMSIGTWILTAFGGASAAATVSDLTGILRPLGRLTEVVAAMLGPMLASYTAALVADTAVPAWHEARHELPFVFVGSGAASAGAAAVLLTPTKDAGAARRLAIGGALVGLGAFEVMHRRLGPAAKAYDEGVPGMLSQAAKALTGVGALGLATVGRLRPLAMLASGAILAGSLCERFAIFRAGFASAAATTGVSALEGPVSRPAGPDGQGLSMPSPAVAPSSPVRPARRPSV